MQSTYLPDAQNFSVFDSSFNHIQGNQYNYTDPPIPSSSPSLPGALVTEQTTSTTTTVNNIYGNQINKIVQRHEKKPTEFDDFRIVKRGDICRYRDVVQYQSLPDGHQKCTKDGQCESCQQQRVNKTVCIAKVNGAQGKFMVMTYSGPGRQKAFERDFRKYSSVGTSRVPQMYAVDVGSIPSIVYWNELIPVVLLKGNLGCLGEMYLDSLRWKWSCEAGELWIDPTQSAICRGPEGPSPSLNYSWQGIEDMPSTVDLLQDDVCLRFMASCKSKEVDYTFVEWIGLTRSATVMPNSFDQPTVISTLTQAPIAIANNVWADPYCKFGETKVLDSGLTRWALCNLLIFLSIMLKQIPSGK
ncbi:hypothetical protein PQX77_018109 [Marasmius sp. AFHP31]|nr:hypothetical protein PQX77_018109 [Marasmius sp. AFHP31]